MSNIYQQLRDLLKIGLEQKQIPSQLFKYRTLGPNTDKIFTDAALWFSSPVDFNDPFDCQHKLDTNNTVDEIAAFLRSAGGIPDPQVIKAANNMARQPLVWERKNIDIIQGELNRTGVCCFAEKNDDLLMWSHYSDSHKGICLKFDLWGDLDFFTPVFNVKYHGDYPIFNYLREKEHLVEKLIRRKSNHWSYEQEYRVVKMNGVGSHPFRKQALKEIIFGCNCLDTEIARISTLAKNSGFNVILSRAVKNDGKYSLDINRL